MNTNMSEIGHVYILSNPSMPGLLKVGFTTGPIEARIAQLMSTGVPTPFHCVYSVEVETPQLVEAAVHRELQGCRVDRNREFFRLAEASARDVLDRQAEPFATRLRAERQNRKAELDKWMAAQREKRSEEQRLLEPKLRAEAAAREIEDEKKAEEFRIESERTDRRFQSTTWISWVILMLIAANEQKSVLDEGIVTFIFSAGIMYAFAFMISFFIFAFFGDRIKKW